MYFLALVHLPNVRWYIMCCALCPFGSTGQQMARCDNVGTWGELECTIFPLLYTRPMDVFVIFHLGTTSHVYGPSWAVPHHLTGAQHNVTILFATRFALGISSFCDCPSRCGGPVGFPPRITSNNTIPRWPHIYTNPPMSYLHSIYPITP